MDSTLQAIADAAERGEDLPAIRLFAGSVGVFGVPTSSSDCRALMEKALTEDLYNAHNTRSHPDRAFWHLPTPQRSGASRTKPSADDLKPNGHLIPPVA